MSNTQIEIGTDSQNKQLNTFYTPSFGDEEFVDVPSLHQMQQHQQHHYQMDPQHQYQQSDTQNMGLLDDQQNQYTLWNPDSQQMYINSNDYELQTNNQMYYTDPMSISNNQPIQSQHNNMMMPPPQKSPQITSPMSFVGQSPHAYGENGTTSDDSDDSLVRGANNLKRPSPEPLGEKLSPTSKVAKVSVVKKPKVQRKRKKKDPNEPQKPVSAYALFFRDTQAAIKGQNPNASFGEVSTIVASMWDVLAPEHKDVYKKKTEAAKAIYLKTLAAYRASVVSKGTDLESPPPPPQPQPQPIQSSPHSQLNNSVPKPHASPQQISQGLPIQHSNQSQYVAAQQQQQQQHQQQPQQPHPQHQPQQQQQMHNSYVPVQYTQTYKSPTHQDYMQQPMHQINNSNINQNHLGYGGYDNHSQQQQQSMHNGFESNGYHMQQSMQHNSHQQQQQQQQQNTNSHQQSHHITGGADQMGATGIAPSPNNAYHHQSTILQKCIRSGCTNQAITSPDWEDEYCSNECVINHCDDVFGNWIQKNGQQQQQTYSAVK